MATGVRKYRGLTPQERASQRRELLLAAGLELFGTVGYARATVREVSKAAGLNSRYFYESFPDREALLIAVYERIIFELAKAVAEATAGAQTVQEQAAAGLRVTWEILTGDRRKARVLAVEVVGVSERLERLRRAYRHGFAQLLVNNAMRVVGEGEQTRLDPTLISRALIGGFLDVLTDWLNGDIDLPDDQIVEHFTELYTAAAAAALGETPAQLRRRIRSVPPPPARLDIEAARAEAGLSDRPPPLP